MPEIIIGLGSIPLTKFGTPSTMEIPDNIRPFLKEYNVFLLENHGALSIGNDVFQAYYRMESLELFAKISFVAGLVGKVNVLSEDEVKKVIKIREQFGLDPVNYPGCRVDGKIIRSADPEGDGGAEKRSAVISGAGDMEKIEISRDRLVELITRIVKNVLNKV
jgi:L-fuculose-phosphate aldolase